MKRRVRHGAIKGYGHDSFDVAKHISNHPCRLQLASPANTLAPAPGVHSALSLVEVMKLKPPIMSFFFLFCFSDYFILFFPRCVDCGALVLQPGTEPRLQQ